VLAPSPKLARRSRVSERRGWIDRVNCGMEVTAHGVRFLRYGCSRNCAAGGRSHNASRRSNARSKHARPHVEATTLGDLAFGVADSALIKAMAIPKTRYRQYCLIEARVIRTALAGDPLRQGSTHRKARWGGEFARSRRRKHWRAASQNSKTT